MADGLQVVSSGLFNSLMSGDGGVPRCSRQVLTVLVGDVLSLCVLEALSQAEINHVDRIFGRLSPSDQEIIRLDIPVDYPLFMHLLNTRHHLNRD